MPLLKPVLPAEQPRVALLRYQTVKIITVTFIQVVHIVKNSIMKRIVLALIATKLRGKRLAEGD